MRIVLVAPGVGPPWTEGRKNFVRDLAGELERRGHAVRVIVGADTLTPAALAGSSAIRIDGGPLGVLRALAALRRTVRSADRPERVLVFPFGTFQGLRGAVNRRFARSAQAFCKDASVPAATILYSCAGSSLAQLASVLSPLAAVGRALPGVVPIHLGIVHPSGRWREDEPARRILFAAGYQEPSRRLLHAVLYERGLIDLLTAGDELAALGASLTVAIPLLRDPARRADLLALARRLCPRLDLRIEVEVDFYAALSRHDAFAFPYRTAHEVFVPTSMLEAMSWGIPVIASNQPMYAKLTRPDSPRCELHHPGAPAELAACAARVFENRRSAIDRAARTRDEVRAQWTLQRAVDELLALAAFEPIPRAIT